MLYRIVDNEDGAVLAICFTEEVAKNILAIFPKDEKVSYDEKMLRYVYENYLLQSQIGDTLSQMGKHIQQGKED